MTLGAINHVALTVSDLGAANARFAPVFEFLGYARTEDHDGLTVWISRASGTAVNLWQARPALRGRRHEHYAPGLHHLAFNASTREQVDECHALLTRHRIKVLDPPAQYDYAPGYYAVFFEGPDGMKLELAHIPGAEAA